MKVYIVHQEDWDGGVVYGVFASFDAAQAYVDHAERIRRAYIDGLNGRGPETPQPPTGFPYTTVSICEREVLETFNPEDFE